MCLNGWDDVTAALQLLSHLDGDALNAALLVPESQRAMPEFLMNSLSDHYNSPGRRAEYKHQFQRVVRRSEDDPSVFAIEQMVRDRFIDGQADRSLRRHLASLKPSTLMIEMVDSCRIWERHCEPEIRPRMGTNKGPVHMASQVTEDRPMPEIPSEIESVEAMIRKLLPTPRVIAPVVHHVFSATAGRHTVPLRDTMRYVNAVGRGRVFRSRRRTLVVIVVLVLGRREEAHHLHYFLRRRSVRRFHLRLNVLSLCVEKWGRPSSDTCLVQPPDVILPLTTIYVNAFGRGSVFRSRRRTQVVLVLSQMRGGTSAALFLRRSDARAVVYRPTKRDLLRSQKKCRRRSCCPVFLCSSPSTRDVAFGMFSTHFEDWLLFESNTTG